jgi:cytochrome c oxidase assembly protein subunit 15
MQAALAARFRARRFVRRASWAAALVVVAQAALGAVVVKRDLHATLVTAHYLLALLLVALTTGAAAATWVAERGSLHVPTGSRRLARMSAGACGATLLVLVVGAYVREKGAGLAFRDWPLMSGRLIPPLSASPSSAMFLHRALAALVLGHVIATVMVARKDGRPGIALCAWTALGCYVGQIALGAANVWTRLAPASVLGHVLLGSLVWAALVCLLVLARARPDVPARLAPRETLAAERA